MSNERIHTHQDSRPFTRFGALWHQADFLKSWAGETVSPAGSQATTLALPLTAVILFKATSVQLGFLSAAGYAPFLFSTLFAGVWVDHHRCRPILLATNIGHGVLLALIPVLAVLGWLRTEELYGTALLVGCLTVVFSLAVQAFLPILLQRDQFAQGNRKPSASQSIAEIGGPGSAGLLVQGVSAPIAMMVDALSFFVAASICYVNGSYTLLHGARKVRKILQTRTTTLAGYPDLTSSRTHTFSVLPVFTSWQVRS